MAHFGSMPIAWMVVVRRSNICGPRQHGWYLRLPMTLMGTGSQRAMETVTIPTHLCIREHRKPVIFLAPIMIVMVCAQVLTPTVVM
jgi:hypothetical protein